MGRMGASEYYNDNLKRLLREDGGQSYPLNQESRDYGQAAYRDARREKTLSVNYRPVQTPYHMNSTYRRNARAAERPKAPMYDSESYRIGERDERRSKIDGVYGRRQSDSGDRSDYASHIGNAQIEYLSNNRPEIIVQDRSDANRPAGYRPTRQWQQTAQQQARYQQPQQQPVRPPPQNLRRDQSRILAETSVIQRRSDIGQADPRYGQQISAAPRRNQPIQSPHQQSRSAQRDTVGYHSSQTEASRPVERTRPDKMQTTPGGGMSYDARYGGEIKPTSAAAEAEHASPQNMSRRDKAAAKKEAKKEKNRLDPEAEAEIRENRRLYKEYVDNERRTMDRAERDRRRMEEYYAARSGKFARKLRELFILTAAFAVTLGLICVIVYKFLFVVSEVEVYGQTVVDADSVIAASGVEQGDNLYSFSASAASAAVTLRYPIIKSVAVKRTIPNKVAFTVTDDTPVFYSDIYGENRMLSADLRVMGAKDDSCEGLIKLKLPLLAYAVDGRVVQYASGKQNRYVADIIATVLSSPLAERMTMIDLTHSYDVKMVCDGKYLLSFGESEEIDIKMKIAAAVLADELFSGGNKATVDLSDTSQTSVIIDNQLVLD